MSQAAGKKGGKGPPKKSAIADDDKTPTAKASEDKDETSSNNGDKKEVKENNGAEGGGLVKPPSAGINIREVAGRILVLAQKGEWPAVEQTLKVLEKLVSAGGEDAVSVPMAGILDPVSVLCLLKVKRVVARQRWELAWRPPSAHNLNAFGIEVSPTGT